MRVWIIQSTQHRQQMSPTERIRIIKRHVVVREHDSWEVQTIRKSVRRILGTHSIVMFAFKKQFTIRFNQLLRNLIQIDLNERPV